jgi:hypothetical protein
MKLTVAITTYEKTYSKEKMFRTIFSLFHVYDLKSPAEMLNLFMTDDYKKNKVKSGVGKTELLFVIDS